MLRERCSFTARGRCQLHGARGARCLWRGARGSGRRSCHPLCVCKAEGSRSMRGETRRGQRQRGGRGLHDVGAEEGDGFERFGDFVLDGLVAGLVPSTLEGVARLAEGGCEGGIVPGKGLAARSQKAPVRRKHLRPPPSHPRTMFRCEPCLTAGADAARAHVHLIPLAPEQQPVRHGPCDVLAARPTLPGRVHAPLACVSAAPLSLPALLSAPFAQMLWRPSSRAALSSESPCVPQAPCSVAALFLPLPHSRCALRDALVPEQPGRRACQLKARRQRPLLPPKEALPHRLPHGHRHVRPHCRRPPAREVHAQRVYQPQVRLLPSAAPRSLLTRSSCSGRADLCMKATKTPAALCSRLLTNLRLRHSGPGPALTASGCSLRRTTLCAPPPARCRRRWHPSSSFGCQVCSVCVRLAEWATPLPDLPLGELLRIQGNCYGRSLASFSNVPREDARELS